MWHGYLVHLPRVSRNTIGVKVENYFTECLELSLLAGYAPRDKKLEIVYNLSSKFDSLKFFLKILWEMKMLDTNKYTVMSDKLSPVGKMIGGWLNMLR